MSFDNTNWVTVLEDTLASVNNVGVCKIPMVDFEVFAQGRYIRFTAITYYSRGAGLNYMTWDILH